jgi:hypothetical protein
MSNFLIDEDTDLLAAEFVLGTLDSEERANAQSLLRTDHGFIAMVRIWERRFGELHLMVEPVEPDAKIAERIKAKIAEIAPSGPAADGKPAVEGSPQPAAAAASPASPDIPKPATLPTGEVPKPPDAAAAAAPQDVPATEASATVGTEKPPETPPAAGPIAPDALAPGAVVPGPVIPTAVAPNAAEGAIPAPPSLPPSPLKLPDQAADKVEDRPARRAETTIDVTRSRDRWRMLGVCMTLLVVGLAALLAAWRFIPDRLPARLRPAELMTSIGIQALPRPTPAVRPAPPESQFDE